MIYIISYPRSGNTLTRYLLELVTGKPTNGLCGQPNKLDILQKPLIHDGTDYIAHKRHDFQGVTEKDFVFFIIRHPIEAIIRHNEGKRPIDGDGIANHMDGWFALLKKYDQHIENGGNGMVLYYEELVKIGDPKSRKIYPNPRSEKPGDHLKKIDPKELNVLTQSMALFYPELTQRYLTRYL